MSGISSKKLPIAVTILKQHVVRLLKVEPQEVDYRWHAGWEVAFRINRELWDRRSERQLTIVGAHVHKVENYGADYLVVFRMFATSQRKKRPWADD